jgi:uncharacterized protein
MQKNIDAHLHVSWSDYHDLIEQLAIIVAKSNWQFDTILCLARGGLRVGDILSRIFDVPLAILSTSSYREHSGTQQGCLKIAEHITLSKGDLSGNILLLDDLADSGKTLLAVQQHLLMFYSKVLTVKTGVLWWKDCSQIKPDFYVQHLLNNPWIHQPFEQYDTMRPKDLM